MPSQLLKKRASTLNESLADPRSGEERPASPDVYDNPFASKTREENAVMATISQHDTPKFLPARDENRTHLDEDVKKEIQMEKEASGPQHPNEWVEAAKALNPSEVKLLKLVQRKSGQDPVGAILPYSGMNSRQLLTALNGLANKGYIGITNGNPVSTDSTERLLKTHEALKSGSVVASWKASLLNR